VRAFANAVAFIEATQPAAWRRPESGFRRLRHSPGQKQRTAYRELQRRYPEVSSAEDIERLFDTHTAVDLYFDVVLRATEWPTRDFSIKTLATYLGFAWRDQDPSGAASIEYFNRWLDKRDPAVKQRISRLR
jgi:predicted RecB family nuclease